MTRRRLRIGVAIAVGYVVIALVTAHWSGRPTLPLFEGVGPAPSYQWVNPPSTFSAGNVRPKPVTETIPLTASGNRSVGVSSLDGQFVLQLPAGAIPGRAATTAATATITPLDPAKLPSLPGGLHPDGNAYQLAVRYDKGPALTTFAKTSSVVMQLPYLATGPLFNAPEQRHWVALSGPASHTTTMGSQMTSLGLFVGSTHAAPGASGGSNTSAGWVVGAFAIAAVIAGIAVWLTRRRNATTSRAARRRAQRRR